jgi:hypothetical protein
MRTRFAFRLAVEALPSDAKIRRRCSTDKNTFKMNTDPSKPSPFLIAPTTKDNRAGHTHTHSRNQCLSQAPSIERACQTEGKLDPTTTLHKTN